MKEEKCSKFRNGSCQNEQDSGDEDFDLYLLNVDGTK